MKTSQCLFNSATAIRKVFISNAASLEARGQLQRLLLPSMAVPIQRTSFSSSSQRPFSSNQIARARYNKNRPGNEGAPANNDRTMRDYDIVFPWIQIRQENGSLTEPQRTSAILKRLDMGRQSLVLLATPRTDASSKGPEYPICRIVDRQAELAAQAERDALKKKMPKVVSKELEINWATAPHDLRTKMTQLKKFLSKGYQVRVTMMHPKKRDKRRASLDEAGALLKTVESTIGEVPGAKETKPREGSVGETLVLLVQAPTGGGSGAPTETGSPEAVSTDASSTKPWPEPVLLAKKPESTKA
ncbi:hypothetical protein MYCTH_2301162 [Thermothelomyces thermophilus ATCC 42464]|uniref:Translation initiation factor 3 N-terminal domain-containing protein n=1 Tax=Thermothelomyces thermophilus (strain ATCC 42464 / BCRC 31852 / DSM 1799) TaxID=573729 RepID=G2Q956_THET4|nr:uncharacterized protein MYCTH_2301162 [Thermothelomyces thermophilus ATCC 42464]AEO56348.1 hypothetical protein MYCTH_2301162 [Thermothelomyces thermophilus ATCC 42464]